MTRAPIDTDKVREDWNFGHGIELPPAMARGWVEIQMSIIAMCDEIDRLSERERDLWERESLAMRQRNAAESENERLRAKIARLAQDYRDLRSLGVSAHVVATNLDRLLEVDDDD